MAEIEILKWQEGKNLKELSREQIFDAIQKIDHAVFHENGLATKESDIARYEAYKDSYIFALAENEIVGYVCYFPITKDFYKKIIKGKDVYDGNITPAEICSLNEKGNYMFLLSVAILPAFQKQGISKRFSKLLSTEFKNINSIEDIVSYAFTSGGEHFLNSLGLTSVKDMEDGIKLMRQNDNFDLVLAIPCAVSHKNKKNIKKYVKENNLLRDAETRFKNLVRDLPVSEQEKEKYDNYFDEKYGTILSKPFFRKKSKREKDDLLILATGLSSLEGMENGKDIRNQTKDGKNSILHYAKVFCKQLEEHSDYELIFNDNNSNIKTERTPILFGQVLLYNDDKNSKFIQQCAYNFFCVLSELTIDKDKSFKNDAFNIIYFVVPDISYDDLTLLMDQSHEIWCSIPGMNAESIVLNTYKQQQLEKQEEDEPYHLILTDFLASIGYVYFGKIYRIIFSDMAQSMSIENNSKKMLNLLASENYTASESDHQITLSETSSEYTVSRKNHSTPFRLAKKEKFFEDFNMYNSYKAYASLYSYYYIISEGEPKTDFWNRISPDSKNQNFSSEANILFILETELFKITACLVLSRDINEQMKYPDMDEIRTMFVRFINTKPLFEKLQYRYLGAQKEADFIFNQFQIGSILAEYDKSKELLKNYAEVANSIRANKNAKILNFIGIIFTFIAGCGTLVNIPRIMTDDKFKLCTREHILPIAVFAIIIILFFLTPIVRFVKKCIARITAKE